MMHGVIHFSLPNSGKWYSGTLKRSSPLDLSNIWIQPAVGESAGYVFNRIESIDEVTFPEAIQDFINISSGQYLKMIELAKDACNSDLEKVVLSRSVFERSDTSLWRAWLTRLRANLPNAFVYFMQTDTHGSWMGATPETLISKEGSKFQTMSLAGTKWSDEPFGEKEFREQQAVTESICSDLGLSSSAVGERFERTYGNIRHLCSPIQFSSDQTLFELANKLHPTPAVCGLPKEKAANFINQQERYNRSLYTGFLLLDIPNIAHSAFVNLRCLRLFQNGTQFFVGGGINAMSNAELEWIETERKLEAVKQAMEFES